MVTPITAPEGHYLDVHPSLTTPVVRLWPKRVLVIDLGNVFEPGDEGVLLLDDLGGANTLVPIPIGRVDFAHIVRIDDRTALVTGAEGGALLLTDLGGSNTIVPVPAAGATVALSTTRVIGFDADGGTLIRLAPGAPEADPLPAGIAWGWAVPFGGNGVAVPDPDGIRIVPTSRLRRAPS